MFFILFGTRPSVSEMLVVQFVCHFCGIDAPQRVFRHTTRFTVFFVPLFSYGKRFSVQCTNCGGSTQLTEQQAQHALQWAADRGR